MKQTSQEMLLAVREPVIEKHEPNVGELMQAVIAGGITKESADVMERLIAMRERTLLWDAKTAWTRAYHAMRSELPRITALKPVPNNDGSVRYWYAPLDEITQIVEPILFKHGFTASDDTEVSEDGKRITNICILTHKDGHSERFRYSVRIGQGPPKATETQADGSAYSYAKRGAYCNAVGIRIEKDDDARNEGDSITPAQAAELKRRVQETGSDETKFLKFARSETYEGISSKMYSTLDEALRKREGVS